MPNKIKNLSKLTQIVPVIGLIRIHFYKECCGSRQNDADPENNTDQVKDFFGGPIFAFVPHSL